MTATEIVDGVWVGDLTAAHFWQGPKLCVREQVAPEYSFNSLHDKRVSFSYGKVSRLMLDETAIWIDEQLVEGRLVLIHCSGGLHRSPLVVVWWLHTRKNMTIEEAYALVQSLRPEVERRDHWLKGIKVNNGE